MANKMIYEQILGEMQSLINDFQLFFFPSPLLPRIIYINNIDG